MSADVLRRAAKQIRKHAQAATQGLWIPAEDHGRDITDEGWSIVGVKSTADLRSAVAYTYGPGYEGNDNANHDAEYIASWHPAVALAVADWLDTTARDVGTSSLAYHAAVTVARAYLGEPL